MGLQNIIIKEFIMFLSKQVGIFQISKVIMNKSLQRSNTVSNLKTVEIEHIKR